MCACGCVCLWELNLLPVSFLSFFFFVTCINLFLFFLGGGCCFRCFLSFFYLPVHHTAPFNHFYLIRCTLDLSLPELCSPFGLVSCLHFFWICLPFGWPDFPDFDRRLQFFCCCCCWLNFCTINHLTPSTHYLGQVPLIPSLSF